MRCNSVHARSRANYRRPFSRGACAPRTLSVVHASAQNGPAAKYKPRNATDAVETGTSEFKKKNYEEALRLYREAMAMKPNDDEARAAMYNAACAHTKLKQWPEAVAAVKSAVNDYNLKVVVALKDADLKPLRERREWLDAQDELTGVLPSIARNKLRAEAKAPFRLTRTTILGGLAFGAGVGLLIITTQLIRALAGPGGPDLQETAKNFAINATALAVLGALVYRDLQGSSRDEKIIEREESLGRLQIDLGGGRVVPLARFRGSVRPVILAGSRGFINKCMREVGPYKKDLIARGVSLVPVLLSEVDPEAKIRALKAEMSGDSTKGFGASQSKAGETKVKSITDADRKWELRAHNVDEWAAWIDTQKAEKQLQAENVYIQVQLDGSVRVSGTNVPNFLGMTGDLPPLDDVRTRLMDGVGPAMD